MPSRQNRFPNTEETIMQKSRFIFGLILMTAVALILVFGEGGYSIGGITALSILGLTLIAISRRKPDRQT
jgi:hypothetical protein